MRERWRDIPGYEGRYQASDHGRVRALDHYVRLVAQGIETKRLSPGRVLKPGLQNRFGHVSVSLGKHNSIGVHILVALTFIGPRPLRYDVAHENGRGGDNRRKNLSYKTRSKNCEDVLLHKRRKLTLEQVKRIKRCKNYAETCVLAERYAVSSSHTYNIMRGIGYAHIDA